MKAIIFFSVLDDNVSTCMSHCTNTAARPSCGKSPADNIKPPFWKFSAPEMDPSRRHCFLINLVFLYQHLPPSFFLVAVKGNYANWDGHLEEKMLTSLVLAAPKYTHTSHTPFREFSAGPLWWLCLFWLSLKPVLTIVAMLPAPCPFFSPLWPILFRRSRCSDR